LSLPSVILAIYLSPPRGQSPPLGKATPHSLVLAAINYSPPSLPPSSSSPLPSAGGSTSAGDHLGSGAMESGGHRSEGGAVHGEQPLRITRNSSGLCSLDVTDGAVVSCSGAEGALCHACGYQYPNGHPSAKQRRAHRKHCGKPESAAGEHQARVLFPGTVGSVAARRCDTPPMRLRSP
jgi:hypothetical protein